MAQTAPKLPDAPEAIKLGKAAKVPTPFLKFSSYDVTSSLLLALGMAVVGAVLWAFSLFWSTLPEAPPVFVPLETIERVGGGVEDGDPDATMNIESPDVDTEEVKQQDEVKEISVVSEVADTVADQLDSDGPGTGGAQTGDQIQQAQTGFDDRNGTLKGTGNKRPLGFGPGNGGGVAAELRWFIRFADGGSLSEYAKQLDFFGIELGAIMPDNRLAYISGLAGTPKVRYANSGKDEKRLYMKWEGGERRRADEQLFKKAGIDVGRNVIFHFYPQQTEAMLVTLETQFANRKLREIRRTYFSVNTQGKGYEFQVTRQMYLK
jgi:hypothetical protein